VNSGGIEHVGYLSNLHLHMNLGTRLGQNLYVQFTSTGAYNEIDKRPAR